VLGYTDEELVSSDVRGQACTSVFDAKTGLQLDSTFVKLVAWYDHEGGYASKQLDPALQTGRARPPPASHLDTRAWARRNNLV
jgi:glyceraldehyde 3-phosphate dehydrogenase